MSARSLKQALRQRRLSLNQGLYNWHPFYQSAGRATFPYKTIRALIQSLDWPAGYTRTESHHDYPKDQEPGWSDELNGVSHDDNTWYFTQKNALWMFPVGRDLDSEFHGALAPILGDDGLLAAEPTMGLTFSSKLNGYTHLGDLDYFAGRLYIPVEGAQPPLVVSITVKDQKVRSRATDVAKLTNQIEAPWCAINPLNGLLYSSNFRILADDGLSVYRPHHTSAGFTLEFVGRFHLFDQNGAPITVDKVQGGVFSAVGHLYLVSDDGTGILAFDMLTGRLAATIPVDYDPTVFGLGPKEELEGITIWDLNAGQAPNIRGEIHLIMIDNFGSGADDLYFKHFKVTNPMDRDKI